MRTAVLLALVACSSSPNKPAEAPAANGPSTCARVADHLISLMTDTAKDAPTEQLDRVRGSFTRHCEDDGWSDPAQQCFLGLTAKEDVDRCAATLTEAQQKALEQAPAPAPPAGDPVVPGT